MTARLWDAASGKQLAVLEGHTSQVNSVCFSPDGSRVATAGDHTARLWDAASGKQLIAIEGHAQPVASVTFSPDGDRILTGSIDLKTGDGKARLWIARESQESQEKRRQEQQQLWREQQAADAEKGGQWFAAAFDLSRLIDSHPADASLYGRRAAAYARQGQWTKAAADLLKGTTLLPPAANADH